MARIKIDYGIDLGTTNSTIARMDKGKPVIIKTDTLKDTLPSCVTINKKQMIQVGDAAYTQLNKDRRQALKDSNYTPNTFVEFKRTMGTKEKYNSSNLNKEFTSEELSSEVLKKLKSLVTDENIASIVITVPAKFTAQQKDSTVKAAKLTGYKHVELLQEPIAAAMAYGIDSIEKDGFWLVFDFGGGTFDAALLKVDEGVLVVKDTEGDNWLGGKNIDYALIDELFIPYFTKNYSIESVLGNTEKLEVFRNAWKAKAEEGKIALSFEEKTNIMTDLGEDFGKDDKDVNFELDLDINQQDFENVARPIFQKAIDLCKELLKRNNLKGSDLDALILIGGPTYAPALRKMLKEQITEKVNTSVDPMTAVAKGAALFASTIAISDEVIEENRDKTKIQLDVQYASTSIGAEEFVTIKVLKDKTEGVIPEKLFIELERGDKAWSSGKKELRAKTALIAAELKSGTSNSFTILLTDDFGNALDSEPNQFTILQGITGGEATLPYHIGIEITDKILEQDVFIPIKGLEKNKELPATGVSDNLKTQKQIRPGIITDFILIPIYQGDYNAEGTRALYNNHIGDVQINGETMPALLPQGSDVEITIKVDRSEQMVFKAFFPIINHSEEITVELKSAELINEKWLEEELLKAQKTASKIQKTKPSPEIEKIYSALSELKSQLVKDKGSSQGKFMILENLRKELRQLDHLQVEAEWPKIEKELKDSFFQLEDLLGKIKANSDDGDLNMEMVDAHMKEYKGKIEIAIKDKNTKDAKELMSEITSLDYELRNAVTGNAIDVQILKSIDTSFNSITWNDKNKARQLINQGLQKAATGNTKDIRSVLIQIIEVMDRGSKEGFLNKLTR